MYLFTAGHCVSSSLDNSISADNSEDEKELVVINDNLDFAVLPLKKNSGIILRGFNPWYMDDDLYANEEFYTSLKRYNHPSFDSQTDSISPDDDYPFLDAGILQPGTQIVKSGATSGITAGLLVGLRAVQYETPSGKVYSPRKVIVVQWEPGQPFTRTGDSGSVYYAKIGSFTYPIAIHRGVCKIETDDYLSIQSGVNLKLASIMSFGTPIVDIINEFKKHNDDFYTFEWFKSKSI